MKYRAEYHAGQVVYEVTDDVVTIDRRNEVKRDAGFYVVPDIQPYRAVAADVATGGTPVIQGRRQHREFLKRNDYVEVGNEKPKPVNRQVRGDFDVRSELARVTHQIYSRDNR